MEFGMVGGSAPPSRPALPTPKADPAASDPWRQRAASTPREHSGSMYRSMDKPKKSKKSEAKSAGIRVGYSRGVHRVEEIERGSSADLCGLVSTGDVVLAVDGCPAAETFGANASAKRVKGQEGSLVVVSLQRGLPGLAATLSFEVELFYGALPPGRLAHMLENSVRSLGEEQQLCQAEEEEGRVLGRKLFMDKEANMVLEGRVEAAKNALERAKASLNRSTRGDSWWGSRLCASPAWGTRGGHLAPEQNPLLALCFGGLGPGGRKSDP